MTPALYEASAHAVQVLPAEGGRLEAGRAVLFVLGQLGYRGAERVFSTPPLIWGVEVGYRFVARHRGFFGRFISKAKDPAP